MRRAYDINIEQGQKLTKGATVLVAVDLFEVNGQAFTVASGTISLYNGADVVDANIDEDAVSIGVGLRDSVRVRFTVQGAWTADLAAGDDYYFIWTLTLGDGQTRIARQSVEIEAA